MEHKVKILMKEFVTHDVKRFIVEKPQGYKFIPGQATEISINKPGFENKRRPFTFTSLDDDLVLEFVIKQYPKHDDITKKIHELIPGDELILKDVFGVINYKGKGVFIAGGTGITPFIAIFRKLQKDGKLKGNKLFFSNKTQKDIMLEKELKGAFGSDLILTLTQEKKQGYEYGRIDEGFLKKHIKSFNQNFYICGTKDFVKDIKEALKKFGAKIQSIVIEK